MMSERTVESPAPGEARIWIAALNAGFPSVGDATSWLSADDRARAAQHREGAPRDRFIAARAALRDVLARSLGTTPERVALRREPAGKLVLDGTQDIHFSLSHSGDYALIAVARAPVGVDIEHVREPGHLVRTARRLFHEDTVRALVQLPAAALARAFIAAWTVREAHVKAVGGGMFRTPDTLPFDLATEADGTLHRLRDRFDASLWSVALFLPSASTIGAVALQGDASRIHFHHYRGEP